MGCREAIFTHQSTIDSPISPFFSILNFLFPIFLNNFAARDPERLTQSNLLSPPFIDLTSGLNFPHHLICLSK